MALTELLYFVLFAVSWEALPPLLYVQNERRSHYYIIGGSNDEKMNEAVQDFVAEPVEMEARLVQYDDWIVMYVNAENGIERYSYIQEHFGNDIIACSEKCNK